MLHRYIITKTCSVGSLLLALFFAACTSQAQNAEQFAKETDEFLTKLTNTVKELPSISVVVVKGDRPVFMKSYGYADIANKVKAQNNTPYYIASSTKSFMGMAAAILDHQGKVKLNATLAESMPYIKFDTSVKADQVKLRDLLTHTSGIKNAYFGFRAAYSGNIDRKEMDWVLENKSGRRDEIGKYRYTNLGYNIYTHMTDKKLGMPWQDVLDNLLFKPLGMKRTTAYMSLAKKKGWKYAKPYFTLGNNGYEELYLMKKDNTMQSAGGVITTVEDMANWLIFNINEGKFKGKQLVPAKVVRMAHSPLVKRKSDRRPYGSQGYGLGWENATYQGKRVLQHDGGFAGFRTHVAFMPDTKVGITVLVNDGWIGGHVAHELSRFAFDWWMNEGKSSRNLEAYIKTATKKVKKYRKLIAKDKAKRAKRAWTLTEPLASYVGTYYNKSLGKVCVKLKNGKLEVSHGNMHAVAEPYPKENAIRLEMVPKRGWGLKFIVEQGKKASALSMDGDVFKRIQSK
ncbi:serine hydrolase [uncultured Microscilla sp.]|uniref:serine hydrolase domain-containing protein n=1 Tax=uncultured Microscilla sp. TaxID=432653 RepID=UPI00262702F5|nr:serine hydrolase domain-containing protein [uncultured Microscilla sp.]